MNSFHQSGFIVLTRVFLYPAFIWLFSLYTLYVYLRSNPMRYTSQRPPFRRLKHESDKTWKSVRTNSDRSLSPELWIENHHISHCWGCIYTDRSVFHVYFIILKSLDVVANDTQVTSTCLIKYGKRMPSNLRWRKEWILVSSERPITIWAIVKGWTHAYLSQNFRMKTHRKWLYVVSFKRGDLFWLIFVGFLHLFVALSPCLWLVKNTSFSLRWRREFLYELWWRAGLMPEVTDLASAWGHEGTRPIRALVSFTLQRNLIASINWACAVHKVLAISWHWLRLACSGWPAGFISTCFNFLSFKPDV